MSAMLTCFQIPKNGEPSTSGILRVYLIKMDCPKYLIFSPFVPVASTIQV